MADDQIVERRKTGALVCHVHDGPTFLARRVDVREVELLIGRADGGEEVEGVVQHPVGISVRPVDLVEHQDRAKAELQRLAQHELRLRHHAFFGVDQQEATVHHAEDPLDLAAEVGVAWGVDDVDAGLARLAVPQHGGGLGEDGDPAFALLIIGVHRPFDGGLVGAENAGLRQQLIDECGLAMIDVGDDGDISEGHEVRFWKSPIWGDGRRRTASF